MPVYQNVLGVAGVAFDLPQEDIKSADAEHGVGVSWNVKDYRR